MKGYKVVINLLSTKTCDILVNDVKRLLSLIFCDANMLFFIFMLTGVNKISTFSQKLC